MRGAASYNHNVMRRRIIRCADLHTLSIKAAEHVGRLINLRVQRSGWCSLVLSGGTTPGPVYERLADADVASRIPWKSVHVFWGDERCVAPTSSQSNFRLASSALLFRVPLPEGNIHRIRTENMRPADAAILYEEEIQAVFRGQGRCGVPEFDIVLLGLGTDGHTASLFANDAALEEKERMVMPVCAPAGYEPRERVTLTLRAINNAYQVIFLVSGQQKGAMLRSIFDQRRQTPAVCPAARVRCRTQTVWFISEQ